MKMMKKCLALLLVLTMVFALAACSKTETTEPVSYTHLTLPTRGEV